MMNRRVLRWVLTFLMAALGACSGDSELTGGDVGAVDVGGGAPDTGLMWEGPTTAGGEVCWAGNMHTPNRHGEYKFVVGVRSTDGDSSPHWPYWIRATK